MDIAVAWGDMDAYGHVNNTVFFRWFETGRIAFRLRARGDVARVQGASPFRALQPLYHPETRMSEGGRAGCR